MPGVNSIRNGGGKIRIAAALGTRPEGIKYRPLIKELQKYSHHLSFTLIDTGQHPDLTKTFWEKMRTFTNVSVEKLSFTRELSDLSEAAFKQAQLLMAHVIKQSPAMLLVQGDTISAYAASLAAFMAKIPIGHIEAGLRTGDMQDPFPEEMSRRFIGSVATLHFAPTPNAKDNLISEGVSENRIFVTGNTGIDALRGVLGKHNVNVHDEKLFKKRREEKNVIITIHRRENWEKLHEIFSAIGKLAEMHPDHIFHFYLHPNIIIKQAANKSLPLRENVKIAESLEYEQFVLKMLDAKAIITDSGGIQEEASDIGIPVFICREKTERQEAVTSGIAKLVGSDRKTIIREISLVLGDDFIWENMAQPWHLFGDGRASGRIVDALLNYFKISDKKPETFIPSFPLRPILGAKEFFTKRPWTIRESVEKAEDWLFNSGIQDISDDLRRCGGFYSWIDLETNKSPFLYSEITGYALSMFSYLYKKAQNPKTLLRAELAADWLFRVAFAPEFFKEQNKFSPDNFEAGRSSDFIFGIEENVGAVESSSVSPLMLTKYYLDKTQSALNSDTSFLGGIAYSFDNGMIVNGLLSLYSITKNRKHLNMADDIMRFMVEKMQMRTGLFYATYDVFRKRDHDDLSAWSRHPGSHHVKLAIGLTKLYQETKKGLWLSSLTSLVGSTMDHASSKSGRFRVFGYENETYTHYHLYSIEGLLYVALNLPESVAKTESDIFGTALRAFKWTLDKMFIWSTGGIAKYYKDGKADGVESSDILAQTLRLGALFISKSEEALSASDIQKLDFIAQHLVEFQNKSENSKAKGGFSYGYARANEFKYWANSWSTMFALQALDMYLRAKDGDKTLTMENFI